MNYLEAVRNVTMIASSGEAATTILKHLANRKRSRKAETVRRLMQICGKGTNRAAVVRVLRQLESSGFGKLVVGRRGYESRFEWAGV